MLAVFQHVMTQCPGIASNYSIGESVNKASLQVLRMSGAGEAKQRIKLVGGIHGNEAVGRECLINLIQYLCAAYTHDDLVTKLLDNIDIHFLPQMNPDGFAVAQHGEWLKGRANGANIDLNRNFPDRFAPRTATLQPETSAVMKWTSEKQFTTSISLHGGSLVACYPFDNTKTGRSEYSGSLDDKTFVYLASSYANTHPTMHNGETVCGDRFVGGISNGASWYSLNGGMQDWNYLQCGTMEITIEMGCDKLPLPPLLLQSYKEHYPALIDFIKNSRQGFWGRVTDSAGAPIDDTLITAPGIGINITARGDGYFWRVAAPGDYEFVVTAPGYESHVHHVTVGKVDWLSLSEPITIQLLLSQSVRDTVSREATKQMIAKRVVSLTVVVVILLVMVMLGVLWRVTRTRNLRHREAQKTEFQGLIDNASDSEDDEL